MTPNPIQFEKSADGTYELIYFGRVAGWARKAVYATRPGEALYRVVSVHGDRKSTRLNSSHTDISRMPSSA